MKDTSEAEGDRERDKRGHAVTHRVDLEAGALEERERERLERVREKKRVKMEKIERIKRERAEKFLMEQGGDAGEGTEEKNPYAEEEEEEEERGR